MRALLGLGSNLGDRRLYLKEAMASLSNIISISPIYKTKPINNPKNQNTYLNCVVELDTDLSPRALLGVCHRLESAADRVRDVRWGPRTLDVDILWHEQGPVDEPDLQIPHPRMHERLFVMAPLAEIAPDLAPAGWEDRAEGRVALLGDL